MCVLVSVLPMLCADENVFTSCCSQLFP